MSAATTAGERRVRWIDQLPATWQVVPSKWLFSLSTERARPDDEQLSASQDDGVISQAEFMRRACRQVVQVLLNREILKHVEPNDFVISMRSFQGGLERSWARGCISSAYVILKPSSEVHVPFFAHVFKSTGYIQALQATSNLVRDGQALRYENFSMVYLPRVPMEEQRAIAAFLDRKTAAIDELIAKKERLLALLGEKRAALIHQAVTKGLDPSVPMKDSGLPWIGEIPAHWNVRRMRYLCRITTGGRDTQDAREDGQYPFFVRSDTIQRIDTYSFDGEAVLTSGDGAGVGKIFHHYVGKLEFHQRVYLFYAFREVLGRYLYFFLKQHLATVVLEGTAKSTVDSIRRPMLTDFPIAFGSEADQRAIVGFLDRALGHMDQVVARVEAQIERLREYRQALVTAAVTGQLDVTQTASGRAPPTSTADSQPALLGGAP